MKRILKTIMVILIIIMTAACSGNVQTNDENEIVQIGVSELLGDPNKYENKEIKVEGILPQSMILDENGEAIVALYDSKIENYIKLIGTMPDYGGCDAIAFGTLFIEDGKPVLNVNSFEFTSSSHIDAEEIKNPLTDNNATEFSKMRFAAERFSNMNWNQFFKNPTSLADGYPVFIVGKVIDLNIDDNYTTGLIECAEGNIDTTVAFSISNTCYDIYEGDLICFLATIDSTEGSYTMGTGGYYSCPSISVVKYFTGSIHAAMGLMSDEDKNYIYTTYTNTDGFYTSEVGESFEFTENTFAGYSYDLVSAEYEYGTILVSNYNIHSNHMCLNLELEVNVPNYYTNPVTVHLRIYLDGSAVKVNFDDNGYETYYR